MEYELGRVGFGIIRATEKDFSESVRNTEKFIKTIKAMYKLDKLDVLCIGCFGPNIRRLLFCSHNETLLKMIEHSFF